MNESMELSLNPLVIEVTKLCNMKCTMCVSHGEKLYKGQSELQPNFIDFDFFKDLVMQYKALPQNGTKSILPQFQGEPLLYPKFYEVCEFLNNQNMDFSFTTNASAMTKTLADRLLALKHFKAVTFSYDGATRHTYEDIRLGGKYRQVVRNITDFVNRKSNSNRTDVNVRLNNTELPSNKSEMELLLHLWIDKVDMISSSNVAYKGRPIYFNYKLEERFSCGDLWHFLVILTDGKAVPCCRDYLYEIDIGNLKEKSLADIWFGPEYEYMRRMHLEGRWSELKLCNNCDTWMCRTNKTKEAQHSTHVKSVTGPFVVSFTPNIKPKLKTYIDSTELYKSKNWSTGTLTSSVKINNKNSVECTLSPFTSPNGPSTQVCVKAKIPLATKGNTLVFSAKLHSNINSEFSIATRDASGLTDLTRRDIELTANKAFDLEIIHPNCELLNELTLVMYNKVNTPSCFEMTNLQITMIEKFTRDQPKSFNPLYIEKAIEWPWLKNVEKLNKTVEFNIEPSNLLVLKSSEEKNTPQICIKFPKVLQNGSYLVHIVHDVESSSHFNIKFYNTDHELLLTDKLIASENSYQEWRFLHDKNLQKTFPNYLTLETCNENASILTIEKIWLLQEYEPNRSEASLSEDKKMVLEPI